MLLLTPGFSPVPRHNRGISRFNGFPFRANPRKAVETVFCRKWAFTGLQPGIHERDARPDACAEETTLSLKWITEKLKLSACCQSAPERPPTPKTNN